MPKFKKNRLDKLKYYGNIGKRNNNEKSKGSKKFDKMKYYGIVGKRQMTLVDSDEINFVEKKLDKLKYLGRIGRRDLEESDSNESDSFRTIGLDDSEWRLNK